MSTAGKRLGVLGGTLDPIHLGHVDAAEAAREALGLDEILVVPAHDPPHRPDHPHASAFHRFALAALAIAGHPRYRVSDTELRRSGPSYTLLTLGDLHEQGWLPSQIFFIIGADAFADIAKWYGYPGILEACHFAVVSRPTSVPPGGDGGDREGRRLALETALAAAPEAAARVRTAVDVLERPANTAVIPIHAATRAVSSSDIRARVAGLQTIDDLVPPAVARHIHAHGLYSERT